MKVKLVIFIFLTTIYMLACKNEPDKTNRIVGTSSYELSNGDTINLIYNGLKQGHWVVMKTIAVNHVSVTKTERVVVEEGFYKDNKKEGVWKYFNNDGSLKDSVLYNNGEPVKD